MRLLRGVPGAVLWILAPVLGLVGLLLCVTVILLPLGIPLVKLAGRLFSRSVQLMLPRALVHPVDGDNNLAAQFWRLARRIGKTKAALAVGHSILVIAWHVLHNNATYTDLGADWFVRRTDNNTRRRDRLISELQGMRYRVSLDKAAS